MSRLAVLHGPTLARDDAYAPPPPSAVAAQARRAVATLAAHCGLGTSTDPVLAVAAAAAVGGSGRGDGASGEAVPAATSSGGRGSSSRGDEGVAAAFYALCDARQAELTGVRGVTQGILQSAAEADEVPATATQGGGRRRPAPAELHTTTPAVDRTTRARAAPALSGSSRARHRVLHRSAPPAAAGEEAEAVDALPTASSAKRQCRLSATTADACGIAVVDDGSRAPSHAAAPSSSAAPVQGYMEARLAAVAAQTGGAVDDLFAGMAIYIDGYTGEVTGAALVAHIYRHGGTTLLAPAMSLVTHILATHLPPRKADAMLRRRAAAHVPILHPSYITDCIAARRRLPEAGYAVVRDTTARLLSAMLPSPSRESPPPPRVPAPTPAPRVPAPTPAPRVPAALPPAVLLVDDDACECVILSSPSPSPSSPPPDDGNDDDGASSCGNVTVDTIPASL